MSETSLQLHGFNNLTKSLSLSLYDIHYVSHSEHASYQQYIHQRYHAERLSQILLDVCHIIGANPLNIAKQDYQPQGASVTIMVAEDETATNDTLNTNIPPRYESIVGHLDKSHLCIHTYPESHPVNRIFTFRADIEISSCGVISPLKALHFLLSHFDVDIATFDYRVRGFTRDHQGHKHYIDHPITSIQDFLSATTKSTYQLMDSNISQANLFHTRMVKNTFDLNSYLFNTNTTQLNAQQALKVSQCIEQERHDIFNHQQTIQHHKTCDKLT